MAWPAPAVTRVLSPSCCAHRSDMYAGSDLETGGGLESRSRRCKPARRTLGAWCSELACLLAFKLTHAGAIAPALHWQGRGRRPRPLPASPCAASAPYPHQLPSRADSNKERVRYLCKDLRAGLHNAIPFTGALPGIKLAKLRPI
jgi:hypothetical protein